MKERIDFKSMRKKMVAEQIIARGISDKKVLEAFGKVPRENFVDEDSYPYAYDDRPLPIGYGQTISQPYIVALMTESLELEGDETVLEIGTGSGYQTAMLAEIVKKVYSIEIVIPLYERAKKILSEYKNILLASKDGYYGWKEHSPFDRIIVTAAPEEVPPPLIDQLKDDGIMIVPSGPAGWNQVLLKIIKKNGKLSKIKISDVAFVPLTRRPD
ncbi:MAG: protein-L-isoaspartate(D-aspartate) O-methyltransferase [Actinobacteria bacterium]|nr:protein-L-isoaspartate(D-aspartate) O-methyltransferase [Actinomycetota bacterium]